MHANKSSHVSFSIIKTGDYTTLEAFTYSHGSFFRKKTINYSAVYIKHPQGTLLFDTGLGESIDDQYFADMPRWRRPLLKYYHVRSIKNQLGDTRVDRIFLSHSHWDHASGLVDFPQSEIWITEEEKQFIDVSLTKKGKNTFSPAILPSQVGDRHLRWRTYNLDRHSFFGFAGTFDVFGDGSVVMVNMSGHTPGMVGMYLKLTGNREFLFCSDVVWNLQALSQRRPKFFLARLIADDNSKKVHHTIIKLAELQKTHPSLVIVPAHDADAQDSIGYWPKFVG